MSLKEKLSNFGTNILAYIFVIALFTTAIGLGYRGKYLMPKEPNWYVAIFGFICLVPFLIFYYISNRKIAKKNNNELNQMILLKENGIKSEVDLTELEITQNESVLPPTNKITINKYGEKNFQTKLSLKNKINYIFYTDINKDNLKIYFALNPKTSLFTDRKSKHRQYIDLEFLEK